MIVDKAPAHMAEHCSVLSLWVLVPTLTALHTLSPCVVLKKMLIHVLVI